MGVNAEKWFKENAVFRVPLYKRDSDATASSRGVKRISVDRLNNSRVPTSAYRDPTKVSRLIDVADRALRPRNLLATHGFTKDSVIRKEYAKLFSPACESNSFGVLYPVWKQISSERDCQELTRNAVLYSVGCVVQMMFHKELTTRTESFNPDPGTKEWLDFVGESNEGSRLYLCKSKTPKVLDEFEYFIRTAVAHDIQLKPNALPGENVLNKCVFYMSHFDCDHLVLTSFEKLYFFERHEDKVRSTMVLSYSDPIEQDGKSEVFRALLGLTLHLMNIESMTSPPDTEYNTSSGLLQVKDHYFRGAGPSGRSGRSTGGHDLRPNAGRRFSGFSGKANEGRSTKRRREIDAVQVGSPKDCNITDILSISASWSPELQEKAAVKDAGSVVRILGGKHIRYGREEVSEFELEPGVKLPSFPTSDKVPVLEVVELLGRGATGLVCKAKLLHPDNCDNAPLYAVKLVDSEWRSPHEYRNFVWDLYDEYVNYCVLELGKRYPAIASIIKRTTATCYGLYHLRDSSYSSPIFALITEYCGDRVKPWTELGNNDKCAVLDSLICFHALGLSHNDVEARNVVYDDKTGTYKFIDLCASTWHTCAGIEKCTELMIMWNKFQLFEKEFSLDYQQKLSHENNLTFVNTRSLLEHAKEIDPEKLAASVKQLAKDLNRA